MKKAKLILWALTFSMLLSIFSVAALPAMASSVYSFEAAQGEHWSSNSKRAMNRNYTVSVDEGDPQTFSMWIVSSDMGVPLRVYSPEIELDTSAYTSAKISAEFWRNEKEGGPDPECNMTIYYSVDGGKTWAGTLDCSVEKTARKAICDQDTTIFGYVHEITTEDICTQVPDTVITNLKLVPFEGVQSTGAFRILDLCIETEGSSLTVKGAASVDIANDTDTVTEPAKPIEPTSMVYSFEENAGEFWSSNSKRAMNRSYTVSVDEGEPQTFSMWILSPDMGAPLRVYSPEIELDTSACTSVELSFDCWRNEKEEGPDPDYNMQIYYSTDGGSTWEGTLDYEMRDGTALAVCNQDETVWGFVSEVTTGNICDQLPDTVITNLKLVPFEGTQSTGAFRVLDLRIETEGGTFTMKETATIDIENDSESISVPEVNDSPAIQKMIDETPTGGSVTIGVNPRNNSSIWNIGEAISLPSDITVYIDNATLRLADDVFCNIFYSESAYEETLTAEQAEKNIKIIGIGDAVLDGGNHNGMTEKTAGMPHIVHNTFIFLRNVDGFEVSNLTMKASRWWASTFIFCENGVISDITFNSTNTAPNQDGIDLRIGCNNIAIENISGVTGDDTIALTALLHKFDTSWLVEGKDTNIHHINISNVRARCSGGHGVIRLLAQDGNQIQDVTIDSVYDLSIDEGGPRCGQGLLRIGESGYSTVKQNQPGDIDRITISNVTSRANSAIYSGTDNVTLEHLTCSNIYTVEGSRFGGSLVNYMLDPDAEYNVNMVGGTASAEKSVAGMTVTITADEAPEGKVFDRWVAVGIDETTLENPQSATTAFLMPLSDVLITATYRDASALLYGDINTDASVNASDALLALQHSVKLITLEGEAFQSGDVNGDDKIDASDALLILQKSVKLIEQFPVES